MLAASVACHFAAASSIFKCSDGFPVFGRTAGLVITMDEDPNPGTGASEMVGICQQFNRPDGCFLKACRFAHVCSQCHRDHPVVDCGSNASGAALAHRTRDGFE